MKKKHVVAAVACVVGAAIVFAGFTVFFDQAVLVRKDTIFRVKETEKLVAITFDDGPSPIWTPKILDELKRANIKATFFLLGEHVEQYPGIARRIVAEGHEIGNHSNTHHVLLYYTIPELEKEVLDAEHIIKRATGVTTHYFRPPKAWLTSEEKVKLKEMGYEVVLWSLNSKDWVTFDDKYIRNYIVRNVRPGDIILFHDSGGVFSAEGGDRSETVRVIYRLSELLREKGYRFVTLSELIRKSHEGN